MGLQLAIGHDVLNARAMAIQIIAYQAPMAFPVQALEHITAADGSVNPGRAA